MTTSHNRGRGRQPGGREPDLSYEPSGDWNRDTADDAGESASATSDQPQPKGARVEWLDPKSIIWPQGRVTSEYDAEAAAALRQSIEQDGQMDAIVVWQLPDGTYEGAAGYNRCLAAIEASLATVLCLVRAGEHRDVTRSNLITAFHQQRANPRSEVEAIAYAHQMEGLSVEEIMETVSKGEAWVEDRLRIAEASPVVLDVLGQQLIAIGHAAVLSRLEDHAEQERWLGEVMTSGLTVGQLEEQLRGAAEPEPEDDEGEEEYEHVEFDAKVTPAPAAKLVACWSCEKEADARVALTAALCPDCGGRLQEHLRAARPGWLAVPVEAARQASELLAGNPGGGLLSAQLANLLEERERRAGEAEKDRLP